MPFLHEVHGLIHPDHLVFLLGVDHAALLYCTEQLITGPIEYRLRTSLRTTANASLTRQRCSR
jgi:hypothetical protein